MNYSAYFSHLRQRRAFGIATIDLRSEAEFAQGAVMGSANVPLLSNSERHEVGYLYKQSGRLSAVQEGLEIFSRKALNFVGELEKVASQGKKLTAYCWRGGMRSQSVAALLKVRGIELDVLRGGYKGYRRNVLQAIESLEEHRLLVLNGRTGSGKSELLRYFGGNIPVIDFEALANHRGSAFGDFGQALPPPSQQNFENCLAEHYAAISEAPFILVEVESFIGPIRLSQRLRERIFQSPMILLERDFDDRVASLAREYTSHWNNATQVIFEDRLTFLKKFLSHEQRTDIVKATRERDFTAAIATLLRSHYDKAYDKSLAKLERNFVARFNVSREMDAVRRYISDFSSLSGGDFSEKSPPIQSPANS